MEEGPSEGPGWGGALGDQTQHAAQTGLRSVPCWGQHCSPRPEAEGPVAADWPAGPSSPGRGPVHSALRSVSQPRALTRAVTLHRLAILRPFCASGFVLDHLTH